MKRHTKPYGCTFPKCPRKLGSRNDWKRHENSQHSLEEMWWCDICRTVSYKKQDFIEHLQLQHYIDNQQIESKCNELHLGKEGHYHFWCGFCQKLIDQPLDSELYYGAEQGTNAWELRSKHIGDHYDKKNAKIDDWVHIEGASAHPTSMSSRPTNEALGFRPRGRRNFFNNDDSELGPDGIPENYPTAAIGSQTGPGAYYPSSEAYGMNATMTQADMMYSNDAGFLEDVDGVGDMGWQMQ
jgi:hypothetical protein